MSQNIDNLIQSLNIICQSTGDFYYIFDYEKKVFYFSENITEANNALAYLQTVLPLEKWQSIIDSRDIKRSTTIMNKIREKQLDRYNFNFRIFGENNLSTWLNNKGKVYYDRKGNIDYVLGRLSNYIPASHTSNQNSKKMKTALNKCLLQLTPGYLILLGIDDLKIVNLKNGRAFGDGIIAHVIYNLKKATNNNYPVYHIDGDCFALILTQYSQNQIIDFFKIIQKEIATQCTISAGAVSLMDYHVSHHDLLIQYAESALETSKLNGKNQLTFFNPEQYEHKLSELELLEHIIDCINHNFQNFEIYYQPQYYADTFELYGAEALLRFHYGDKLIPSARLISILEQNNLIYQVGLWIFHQALQTCRQWRKFISDFHISINMSCNQLNNDSIEYDILEIVQKSGVPGDAITIEITESMELMEYPHLNTLFKSWEKYGMEISIDDFGTGYSSLSRLKEMAINEIKIDRCFITGIENNLYNYRLLSNITDFANTNQIRICCEGVETYDELKIINELNPTTYQGYLFGKPCCQKDFQNQHIFSQIFNLQKLKSTKPEFKISKEDYKEIVNTILNAENDIFYLSDLDTYQLYYLNPAGQKIFEKRNYLGKKCYQVLHGYDQPCHFCTNKYLRQDSFYIWENKNQYCGRHFLLKDKLVLYRGKKVRLEVALDITDQEYVSQTTKDRLVFANKIVDYMNTLSKCSDYNQAVNNALASICDFYQGDRAYLFERDRIKTNHWDNTFEWCAPDIEPQIDQLQDIGPEPIKRWLETFDKDESVFIYGLSALKKNAPAEWEILCHQNIQRLIAVPLRENNKTIGFVGIDNPRNCIHDDSQLRVLAAFLLTRLHQDRNEYRYRVLLNENNMDLLQSLKIGFWTLQRSKHDDHHLLGLNHVLQHILDSPIDLTEQENYLYWCQKLKDNDTTAIKQAFQRMKKSGQIEQIEHTIYIDKKPVEIRIIGILVEDNENYTKYKGFCRIIQT